MISWRYTMAPICCHLWLDHLMALKSRSFSLVAVTFFICYLLLTTVDQTVDSRYSMKVRITYIHISVKYIEYSQIMSLFVHPLLNNDDIKVMVFEMVFEKWKATSLIQAWRFIFTIIYSLAISRVTQIWYIRQSLSLRLYYRLKATCKCLCLIVFSLSSASFFCWWDDRKAITVRSC